MAPDDSAAGASAGSAPTPLGQRALRGTAVTLAGQMVRFVVQFGSVILLARLLTPDDFGVVAMVTSVVGIAEIIRDFGLSSAAIQPKTLSQAERSNLWWINTGIGALCTFFIVALAPLLSLVYHDDRVVGIALVWFAPDNDLLGAALLVSYVVSAGLPEIVAAVATFVAHRVVYAGPSDTEMP